MLKSQKSQLWQRHNVQVSDRRPGPQIGEHGPKWVQNGRQVLRIGPREYPSHFLASGTGPADQKPTKYDPNSRSAAPGGRYCSEGPLQLRQPVPVPLQEDFVHQHLGLLPWTGWSGLARRKRVHAKCQRFDIKIFKKL